MATVLRTPTFQPPLLPCSSTLLSSKSLKLVSLPFKQSSSCRPTAFSFFRLANLASARFVKFVALTFDGEIETAETQKVQEPKDSLDGAVGGEDSIGDDEASDAGETPTSPLMTLFQSYKEALANNDKTKVAELESSFKSIEDEKNVLQGKVTSLFEELSIEKDQILKISADFDNFQKKD